MGVSLRAARDGYKIRGASPGLWGDWGRFEGGARWLQGLESVAGVVGVIGGKFEGGARWLQDLESVAGVVG